MTDIFHVWLIGACSLAAFFGLFVEFEKGEYKWATTAILFCALWPISLTLGFFATIGDAFRSLRKLIRRTAHGQS